MTQVLIESKAEANDLTLVSKAKDKDLTVKAKAKDTRLKAEAEERDHVNLNMKVSRAQVNKANVRTFTLLTYLLMSKCTLNS